MHGMSRKGAENKIHKFLFDNLEEYYFLGNYTYSVKWLSGRQY
jgi:hypothetical protein